MINSRLHRKMPLGWSEKTKVLPGLIKKYHNTFNQTRHM